MFGGRLGGIKRKRERDGVERRERGWENEKSMRIKLKIEMIGKESSFKGVVGVDRRCGVKERGI